MPYPREEVQATVDRYHELRRRIDEGLEPDAFGVLADFYTEDAVYVDGAWGRLEGRETIARWLVDSMVGMEDWKFPIEFTAIEGDDVVVKWTQILPRHKGRRDAVPPVGLLTPDLRRGRQVLLRGGHVQHGARPRGHRGQRLDTERLHERPAGPPGPQFRRPGERSPGLRQRARYPEFPVFPVPPRPGNPPPPSGLVPPLLPLLLCDWAWDWLPRVAVVVRLLLPTK